MFELRFGEHSPRVTLLQVLLKDEYPLTVDGIFGRHTRDALAGFQSSRGISAADGRPATAETWRRLLRGTDLEVVSSIDGGDPEMAAVDSAVLRELGDAPMTLGGMCNGLQQLVANVQGRVRGGRIAALRLDGHGNLGRWMTVSVGEVVDLAHERPGEYRLIRGEYFSYVDLGHFNRVASVLRPLRDLFAPFGFVEHHGCSLGSRAQTRELMRKLADLWNVPVSTGLRTQDFGIVASFQGPVHTAFPRGQHLAGWSARHQTAVVRNQSL